MTVEDIRSSSSSKIQSRLDTAKEMIPAQFKAPKNVWVISFAKNPTLFIPISQIQSDFIGLIASISPESEVWGSDLPLALQYKKNLYGDKVLSVFIFTDGWDTSLSELPKIPQNWRITIYGLWSNAWGKIPLGYNANGERRYKYFSWSEIMVPYEREKMVSVAKAIGAHLIHLDTLNSWNTDIPLRIFLDNIYYIFSSLLLLFGIIIHPYGRKKNKI